MARKFKIEILSPDRSFYVGETELVVTRGSEGYLGIMYDHEPSVIPLSTGSLRLKNNDGTFSLAACSKGILTIKDTEVTVLVDSVEWVDEIDLDRALRAKERAENRMEANNADIDFIRAKSALERALNRINLSKK